MPPSRRGLQQQEHQAKLPWTLRGFTELGKFIVGGDQQSAW